MNPLEQLKKALEDFLPSSAAEEGINAAKEGDARAQAGGFETKAIDAEAGTKALAAVKALEEKLTEATATITAQADKIAALEAGQAEMGTAQKAHQFRAEKAIQEVANLLTVLNAKPDIAAPPEQEKLAAIEAATKAKLDAAKDPEAKSNMGLQRSVFKQDGTRVVVPL